MAAQRKGFASHLHRQTIMNHSIILASRNGEDTLPMVLVALEQLEPAAQHHEILLVDNASTDRTQDIMQNFAARTGARVLHEELRGKSFALNRAIDVAAGDMLLFLDDDVLPAPGWMNAYERAANIRSDAAVFAGQVRPHWLAPAPIWLAQLAARGRSCGCTNPNAPFGQFSAMQVKGGNMAIRRSALGTLRFEIGEVNFGAGSNAIGGEDTCLVLEMEAAGHGIVHVPDASVAHIIGPQEMTMSAVFARHRRIGRSSAAITNLGREAVPMLAVRALAHAGVMAGYAALLRGCQAAQHMVALAANLGRIEQAWQQKVGSIKTAQLQSSRSQ